MVSDFLSGISCTVFTYGQEKTGKSFTLFGDQQHPREADQGLFLRAATDIFQGLKVVCVCVCVHVCVCVFIQYSGYIVYCNIEKALQIVNTIKHSLLSASTVPRTATPSVCVCVCVWVFVCVRVRKHTNSLVTLPVRTQDAGKSYADVKISFLMLFPDSMEDLLSTPGSGGGSSTPAAKSTRPAATPAKPTTPGKTFFCPACCFLFVFFLLVRTRS